MKGLIFRKHTQTKKQAREAMFIHLLAKASCVAHGHAMGVAKILDPKLEERRRRRIKDGKKPLRPITGGYLRCGHFRIVQNQYRELARIVEDRVPFVTAVSKYQFSLPFTLDKDIVPAFIDILQEQFSSAKKTRKILSDGRTFLILYDPWLKTYNELQTYKQDRSGMDKKPIKKAKKTAKTPPLHVP